ncbi:hypothetical protein ATK17_2101 [Branchiibius hedensis]|uniref:N-acetyltransferase domain-containing protein n=1 Tax=Branchiibius hedensis TaxID=672460 RepID=A0A2Y8ZS68_9MICO|nr:GNAT family N-acetyltransferase [Branchiibius hedensis]PWJ25961.1 hypothetical protein ATK17_2101 [Branchiibius hedensis]SSA34774.1 hypothetical protein SAMN04489750_2101 [Branchiibius hedensis]
MLTVRDAERADRAQAIAALTLAFADDPVLRWLVPPERDARVHATLIAEAGRVQVADVDGRIGGTCLWIDQRNAPSPWRELAGLPRWLWALGPRIGRGSRLMSAFARAHPPRPYLYLGTVGAAIRGQGIGSALIRSGLEDYSGTAYLESSKEENLAIYERFGFRVTERIDLPDGGPPVWPMVRPATA